MPKWVTLQIKSSISPLSQGLCSQYLTGWWHTVRSSYPYICIIFQWGGHVRSRDKLNILYLHMHETYGHQTNQGAILLWEVLTLKPHDPLITWPTRRHVTISKSLYFFLSPVLWLLNLGANLRQEVQHANAQVVTDSL